jgi:hypothetical protein
MREGENMPKESPAAKPTAEKPVAIGKAFAVCGYERCSEVAESNAEGAIPPGWLTAFVDGAVVMFSKKECLDKFVAFRRRLVRQHLG